jgi:[acyl-carrier-protein] S-malonyltransferase
MRIEAMKEETGRWQRRIWSVGRGSRRKRLHDIAAHASGASATEPMPPVFPKFPRKTERLALAFRGYDVSNQGRSRELLAHPRYGTIIRAVLAEVSEVAATTLHRPVDLAARIAAEEPSTLESFPDDVAMIVGMELAQLKLLEDCFGIAASKTGLAIGYSIGELSAMIAGGVYPLDQLLPVPLSLSPDCAELAADTTMGVLFTREPLLDEDEVHRVCRQISSEGTGLIGPSAFLSPNTALILGESDTLDRLERAIPSHFPGRVMLRRNANRWPPLHSPIVWRRNIPNRTATAMYAIKGGSATPRPTIVSCVTGEASYEADNSRDLMIRWTDQPQRLWDAIDAVLRSEVEMILHVGPSPNLIPATFSRITNNLNKLVKGKTLRRIGNDVVTTMSRHAWLAHVLPAKASLLRVPFIEHIILEDWLLAQPVA